MTLPVEYSKLDWQTRRAVREQYIVEQKGMCYYCGGCLKQPPPDDVLEKRVTPMLYPDGFFDNPLHLHHSHVSGMTIGTVHAYCNAVLWEHEGE